MNTVEKWVDIPDFVGFYQASNLGNIRSVDRYVLRKDGRSCFIKGRNLKFFQGGNNRYWMTQLSKDNKQSKFLVHRIIASVFIHPIEEGFEVNHKNGIVTDNYVTNLEIISHQENINHSVSFGLKNDYGEKHVNAKLSNEDAESIRSRHKGGELQVNLAIEYGVSKQTISNIIHYTHYFR